MSVQRFSLDALKKVRQYIQTTLSLAAIERRTQTWATLAATEDWPEPELLVDLSEVFTFGGLSVEERSKASGNNTWFISPINPGAALLKLPSLRLKTDMRLVSFLYRLAEDGVGVTFAIPERSSTTAHLEKAIQMSNGLKHPPKPKEALPHVMEAVEGDRSPVSFVVASLLYREFQEFGALGQYSRWQHHHLIEAIPVQARCDWQVEQPIKDLAAKARILANGQAAVEFFSYRTGKATVIYRHFDHYPPDRYCPTSANKAIAIIRPS
ncbi:hypothetical protein [Thermocoleostomius sinensis]|uniref:Uncharacterized protein n=1 Tax=Thermocoleostomius sinensis A174 TaxID=2016057 RepID=A0A9E9CB12_9CYAN|nr:hypothetical protein [Thermocoleostomius sinensis]WAL61697.1 hypothetical protein OXH18_06855 [Thermocoleostomius sinensis A174]